MIQNILTHKFPGVFHGPEIYISPTNTWSTFMTKLAAFRLNLLISVVVKHADDRNVIYYNDIERSVHVQNHSLIRLFRTHFSLNRGNFERTFVWSEVILTALQSGTIFWAHLVWTLVWNSSGQWSGTCLIRGHVGLELVWSEAASSALRAHNDLRVHTRLIRGHFGLGRSDQRSHLSGTVWSEVPLVWDGLIRGPTCLGWSDQRSHLSGTVWSEVPLVWDGLIRGDFERDLNMGSLDETTWSNAFWSACKNFVYLY